MTTPAAFRATYSDLKLIKTRGVVQIVFELPLADFDAAYAVLGGLPDSSKETWFGIAPIRTGAQPQPTQPPAGASRDKREWRDMQPAQQAGIRCGEPIFVAFLKETYPEDWRALEEDAPQLVRFLCGVSSRAQINTQHGARVIWHQIDTQFQAWKALEHA